MHWREIRSSDDLDFWHWQEEQTALWMAHVAENFKDFAAYADWRKAAERHRQARWPKDRPYTSLYV